MYRDLTDTKPPLGYWLSALAVGIGGANEIAVRLMPVPLVLGTIALVWWIGLRLGGPVAGVVAGFLYAILSTDPYLYGNGAQMEQAMNLFASAALALVPYPLTLILPRQWGGDWSLVGWVKTQLPPAGRAPPHPRPRKGWVQTQPTGLEATGSDPWRRARVSGWGAWSSKS